MDEHPQSSAQSDFFENDLDLRMNVHAAYVAAPAISKATIKN
ncbi:MAG TPA: hypothetical protein VJV05_05240 [Pyrinomonadaceae bacterium]|nr:hypothetical protein [Pyrinomonadaceae bacterium]